MEIGSNVGCEERFCAVIVVNQVKFGRPNLDLSALYLRLVLGLDSSMCSRHVDKSHPPPGPRLHRLTKVWLMPLLLAGSHDVHGIHIAASHVDQGSASQSSSLWDGSLATVPS